jgi:hypothetical protein
MPEFGNDEAKIVALRNVMIVCNRTVEMHDRNRLLCVASLDQHCLHSLLAEASPARDQTCIGAWPFAASFRRFSSEAQKKEPGERPAYYLGPTHQKPIFNKAVRGTFHLRYPIN